MEGFSSRVGRALAVACFLMAEGAAADVLPEVLPGALPGTVSPCPEGGDSVTVVTRKRELWLCRDGAPAARFHVAMGRGGVDKRKRGDGRTPSGVYTLGSPRSSTEFGTFIPIDYPTREQASQGFTGSAIGIHGPPRGLTEPDYPTTAVDWTKGCIATGTDADIDVIAEFVRQRQPTLIVR